MLVVDVVGRGRVRASPTSEDQSESGSCPLRAPKSPPIKPSERAGMRVRSLLMRYIVRYSVLLESLNP